MGHPDRSALSAVATACLVVLLAMIPAACSKDTGPSVASSPTAPQVGTSTATEEAAQKIGYCKDLTIQGGKVSPKICVTDSDVDLTWQGADPAKTTVTFDLNGGAVQCPIAGSSPGSPCTVNGAKFHVRKLNKGDLPEFHRYKFTSGTTEVDPHVIIMPPN